MAYEPKARTSAAERAATTNAAMTSAATTNAAAHSDAASAELPPAQVRSTRTIEPPIPATADEPLPVSSPAATTSESDPIAFVEDDRTPIGAQVGFRNHFRLSLPRVYGLSPSPTALLDRELVASLELGGQGEGLLARLRAGVGIGQTQFSMVFHTNTGGEPVDTVFEQSPQAFYGRAFIAPELVRFVNTTGMLEVGGGYSSAGGFGTVGINLEYRPVSEIALHAGASTWLLWTRFKNGVVDLSTNLNAHIGAVYGF